MARTVIDALTDTIFRRTLDTLTRESVPVSNAQAPTVAREVTEAIKPVVTNATNSEPWYRSRIYLGLITAGIGAIAQHYGVQISGADILLVTDSIPEVVQAVGTIAEVAGLLYAFYGRVVGAFKKPLGR